MWGVGTRSVARGLDCCTPATAKTLGWRNAGAVVGRPRGGGSYLRRRSAGSAASPSAAHGFKGSRWPLAAPHRAELPQPLQPCAAPFPPSFSSSLARVAAFRTGNWVLLPPGRLLFRFVAVTIPHVPYHSPKQCRSHWVFHQLADGVGGPGKADLPDRRVRLGDEKEREAKKTINPRTSPQQARRRSPTERQTPSAKALAKVNGF
mgnify:CR=1 FL=1